MATPPQDDGTPVGFTLNGAPVGATVRAKRPALDVLREDLGVYTLKPGCSPQGICGSCLVRIDGKVRLTCTLPGKSLAGKSVQTLEQEPAREALARCFAQAGAVRCGYCIPGLLTQCGALLERSPQPSDEELRKALNMHTCRCTGWWRVEEAVRAAAGGAAAGPLDEDALLALGERAFMDDIQVPGMLHAAVVWAPGARGVLRALEVGPLAPGARVLVAADLAGLPGALGLLVPVGGEYRGDDAVALVLAPSREAAALARAQVRAEGEALPVVLTLAEAAADAGRVALSRRHRVGDLNRALDDRSLVLVKEQLSAPARAPAYIEPDAALALPRPGGVRVLSNADSPTAQARALAAALGLTEAAVQVEQVPSGGSFGARPGAPCATLAGVGAWLSGRPVRLSLDLEECTRRMPLAPAMSLRVMLGARPDGTLVGLKALVQVELGHRAAGGEALLALLAQHASGAWEIPHVELELRGVRTDNPPAGPVAGALIPWFFALEGCMDRLAERLGLDPLELRLRNAAQAEGAEDPGVAGVLRALEPAWREARAAGRPVGLAAALHRWGGEPTQVLLEPLAGPELRLHVPVPEEGQGAHRLLEALVAERLGLPAGLVRAACTAEVAGGVEPAWVARAALEAADALAVAWGESQPWEALLGRRFEASLPPGPAGASPCAELVELDAQGQIARVLVAQDLGREGWGTLAGSLVDGALARGLGAALGEVAALSGGLLDHRLRNMGVLKANQTPPRELLPLASPSQVGALGLRAWGEVAGLPTAAALAAALAAQEPARRVALPFADSSAAPRRPGARPA